MLVGFCTIESRTITVSATSTVLPMLSYIRILWVLLAAKSKLEQHSLDESYLRDLLLLELLSWFKGIFFRWVDRPQCRQCNKLTTAAGNVDPTSEELLSGATRVEIFFCNWCLTCTRFPRYNNAEKLLETRQGRCGEWANCFCAILRTWDFETRYVVDWTDHVWAEVYSDRQQRWLHSDPCENVCDKPLLYECGWGKKLSYVIGFSKTDIQDVTWRYTSKHEEVMARRTECQERWLALVLVKFRNHLQSRLPSDIQRQLQESNLRELVEMFRIKRLDEKEYSGRTSGSYEWRLLRGELGEDLDQLSPLQAPYTLTPSEVETHQQEIELLYHCADDYYLRPSNQREKILGWHSCLFEAKGIWRKVENSERKSYLARVPNCLIGKVTWNIDLSQMKGRIKKIEICVESTCFENGQVKWILEGLGPSTDMMGKIDTANSNRVNSISLEPGRKRTINDFRGCEGVKLIAILTGGQGPIGWQHAQLFRQELDDKQSYPFRLKVFFTPCSLSS